MGTNPQETADLVTFTEEILNGKLHFLCSVLNWMRERTEPKSILGLVWKIGNTWPKKFLCYPLSKIGVFGFLISWIFREKKQRNKKSWFLVNSRCFCFAFHANLMSDGKKKRLKFLFITPLILLINMSISLFRWTV